MSLIINEQQTIAKLVRRELRAKHMTQRELADEAGLSEQALSNKLRGLKNFTLRDVSRMADCLEVSVDELLGHKPLEVVG
ncbi:helix-turn-helix transcriptional regulator [Bifidobacterium breve]|uniref:helix-turn-helix domain-containing protein n=1 Tax=Bifidobacterium TaxID=1678 RepID=UPI00232DD7BF|nr:helix-turn-helix transcriptional regulator [Bifidobacterium breve]MDB6681098.1 helix-turn-helix transcriptional regulator [Bifidobacterium longum]MDB1176075.1 helix-turn-helix transcriptional regulator [Bifidobacterium breve]MDB1183973.1 helix-turn-helix transcriptional regulator [Bifidobacterium breve]MDB6685031.1 helix-turn-helix transcriptional regulator [Bifidobacterium longum]MDB6686919.1 helix-turn-helix transcriptional regulator [Bifidobacterium longum]